jgi:hypothetical protein
MTERKHLIMYLGLVISLFGVVLYDPLGFLFNGAGLTIICLGLASILFGHKYLNEVENVNKTVENFEAEAKNK